MDSDAAVVVAQLRNLVSVMAYKGMPKGVLAYTVLQYLLLAIECGKPEQVLEDREFQTVFMDARLATDCGWQANLNASSRP
jgi:hypothetical protein